MFPMTKENEEYKLQPQPAVSPSDASRPMSQCEILKFFSQKSRDFRLKQRILPILTKRDLSLSTCSSVWICLL